jgi:hypothetical protein
VRKSAGRDRWWEGGSYRREGDSKLFFNILRGRAGGRKGRDGGREVGREVGRGEERSGGESSADGIGRHVGHAGGEDTVTHYILTRASSAVSICAFVLVKQVKGVPGVHRRLSVHLPHPAARAPLCASTALHHTSAYASIRQHTSACRMQLRAQLFVPARRCRLPYI